MQLVLILVFRFCCHVVGLIEGKINLTDLETLQHCLDRASESHKKLIDVLGFVVVIGHVVGDVFYLN